MIQVLAAFPFLGVFVLLQSSVISRITLLDGKADLVLLAVIGWSSQVRVKTRWQWAIIGGLLMTPTSALPIGILMGIYLISTGISVLLQHRFWKIPLLGMVGSVFLGTLIYQVASFGTVILKTGLMPFASAFNLIILPSVLINFLWLFPIYLVVKDLADWLYPEDLKA